MKKNNRLVKVSVNGLVITCIIIVAFLFLVQCTDDRRDPPLNSEKDITVKLQKADLERMTRLLTVVHSFKEIAQVDYEEALALYADKKAITKFKSFNDHVWVETTPQVGWSYFMSVAVHTVGNVKGRQPLVAFFNPYSDAFLVTAWRMDEALPRIADAEMLMADWLRTGSRELSSVPSWLRTDMFKPTALGSSVAETITAFEQVFPPESDKYWRKELPVLENQQLLVDVNYPAVAIMLFNSLMNIDTFRTAGQDDNPRLESCRNVTIATVRMASQGQMEKLLMSADETLPETTTVLKSLMPEWFRALEAVAVFTGKDGCLVFLAPVFDASGSLSFFFSGKGTELALKRIDVVDYTGFYKNLKKASGAAQKEVSQ
jgi:hypothetical protein